MKNFLISLFIILIFIAKPVFSSSSVWTATSTNKVIWSAVSSSSDGLKMVASTFYEGYIYTSTDGGVTWTKQLSAGNHPWSSLASSSDGQRIVSTVQGGYIYTSSDGGVNWVQRAGSGFNQWGSVASSSDGLKLAAVVDAINGYLYTSSDGGVTWIPRISADNWRDITSSSDGLKLAAVDLNGYIYTSNNGGVSWTTRVNAGVRQWRSIASSSDGLKLAAAVYGGYIYTSTDGGVTWVERTSSNSRTWSSITSSSDGLKLAAAVISYSQNDYIYTSSDGGASWTQGDTSITGGWSDVASSSNGLKLIAISSLWNPVYTANVSSNTIPTVTTVTPSSVTQDSAKSGGTITSNGGDTISVSGIVWHTSSNPTTSLYTGKTTDGWAVGGPWSDSMTGLAPGTTYYVRAYATNTIGTAYGNEVSFTTPVVSGETTIYQDYLTKFSFLGNDPDGDNIRYGIDWNNDSTADSWTNYLASNTKDFSSNSWPNIGTYYFKAITQDSKGLNSSWSPLFKVNVIKKPDLPSITSFSADKNNIKYGQNVKLTWTSNNATSCSMSSVPAPSVNITSLEPATANNNITFKPLKTTTYSLVCHNSSGDSPISQLTVSVGKLKPTFNEF